MRRFALAGLLAAAVLLACAGAAQAHVVISPKTAAPGAFQELTFQAPNENADARFVKLVVHFPKSQPLASLTPRALDGWTVSAAKSRLPKPITTDDGTVTEYTSEITWAAASGAGVPPDEYQDFTVSAGPLPEQGTLVFTVDQFYSDGSVVHWDQPSPADKPEPEHPAPVLQLSDPARTSTSDALARGLAIAGLAVGIVALGAALVMIGRKPGRNSGGQNP